MSPDEQHQKLIKEGYFCMKETEHKMSKETAKEIQQLREVLLDKITEGSKEIHQFHLETVKIHTSILEQLKVISQRIDTANHRTNKIEVKLEKMENRVFANEKGIENIFASLNKVYLEAQDTSAQRRKNFTSWTQWGMKGLIVGILGIVITLLLVVLQKTGIYNP